MGYPLRWEEIAEPQQIEAAVVQKSAPTDGFQRRFRRLVALSAAGSTVLAFAAVGITSFLLRDRSMPALRQDSLPAGAVVATPSPHIDRRLGFVIVTGSVVNRSAKSLKRVEAVVDLLAADRHTLQSQSAMIDMDTVSPGRTSTFQLTMTDSLRATAYRLRFRKLNGMELN